MSILFNQLKSDQNRYFIRLPLVPPKGNYDVSKSILNKTQSYILVDLKKIFHGNDQSPKMLSKIRSLVYFGQILFFTNLNSFEDSRQI